MKKKPKTTCSVYVQNHCCCYSGKAVPMGRKNICCFCGKRRVVRRRKK